MSNFRNIHQVWAALLHADRQTDMTKVIIVFRNLRTRLKSCRLSFSSAKVGTMKVIRYVRQQNNVYPSAMTVRQCAIATRRFEATYCPHFQGSECPRKKNFLQYMSTFKDYNTIMSRNVGILLPTETTMSRNVGILLPTETTMMSRNVGILLPIETTMMSRNVGILLPIETTSYPQGTESSSSAVYIQIPSVYIFCAKKRAICMPLLTATAIVIVMRHLVTEVTYVVTAEVVFSAPWIQIDRVTSQPYREYSFIVARTMKPAVGSGPALLNPTH